MSEAGSNTPKKKLAAGSRRTVAAICLIAFLHSVCGTIGRADDASPSPEPSPTWSPQVAFDDQSSGPLTLRIHPDSPVSCGIDIIEVGSQPQGQPFEPHFAMLRDRYDDTYPGIAPKIRRLYAYDMRPTWVLRKNATEVPGSIEDVDVLNLDTEKRNIVVSLVYALARTVLYSIGSLPLDGAMITVDEFVNAFVRDRQYYRARDLYTLQLLLETNDPALQGIVTPAEIERVLAYGREDNPLGLFVSDNYVNMVTQGIMDQRREDRTRNYANLLAAVNREGLVAQPLFRDFVMVYYDPKRPTAHRVDLTYTDLDNSPQAKALRKNSILKNGLVPLGLYAIGDQANRLLTVDFADPNRVGNHTTIRLLANLATQFGSVFIPSPFGFGITVTRDGAGWVLNKMGRDVLTDTLETEAELAALLDSGVATLDPTLMQQVRDGMGSETDNILLRIQQNAPEYVAENERRMSATLEAHGQNLCKKIAALREAEFRENYLTLGAEIDRMFNSFWLWLTGDSRDAYKQRRKQIIEKLRPLVDARNLLDAYDPMTSTDSMESIVDALNTIAKYHNGSDVGDFRRIILNASDPDILAAAITAAGVHGNGRLDNVLAEFLGDYDFTQDLPNTDAVTDALQAVQKINLKTAPLPAQTLAHLERILARIHSGKSAQLAALADQTYAILVNEGSGIAAPNRGFNE